MATRTAETLDEVLNRLINDHLRSGTLHNHFSHYSWGVFGDEALVFNHMNGTQTKQPTPSIPRGKFEIDLDASEYSNEEIALIEYQANTGA